MLTSRCAERRFFLRPSPRVNNAYLYCFIVAAQDCGLDVYWLSNESNHEHPGVQDHRGNYPDFLRYFHSLLARCLNAHLGRWERFWASEQPGALHLVDGDALFEQMVYALTNPAKDHLVDKVANWPGVNSLAHQLSGKPLVATRPPWFFDPNGKMPARVALHLARPPEFAHLSEQEWTDKLRAAVAAKEREAAAERARTGRRVLGRKAILRQSPYACPKSFCPRRGLKPRVAARNRQLRREQLARNKSFRHRYRAAYERRRAGELEVLFPYGTYALARQGLVRCEPAPALE
jgi:hypothetical protein